MPGPPARIGRYRLLRQLGRGGAAVVWEGELEGPAGFRKAVAVKILGSERPRPVLRDGLIREARIGALLHHPNVVSVLELGHDAGRWFISMELVRGPTVAQLARRVRLPIEAIVDIGIQTCTGLAHIHAFRHGGRALQLIHRDIKPANLLLDPVGLVKVADLGITGLAAELGGGIAGTPSYMAPEQARGAPCQASDLFSLGRVMSRLLRGYETPPSLDAVVERCLATDPAERWATATDLGAALRIERTFLPGPGLATILDELGTTDGQQVRSTGSTPTPTGQGPPTARDRFVGRDRELDQAVSLLGSRTRLLTFTGPGGAGKTRLAQEVAQRGWSRRAWWADCSSCRDTAALASAVGEALGLPATARSPGRVRAVLVSRGRAMLVLDNLEQVIEAAAELVDGWLEAAPDLVVLATSRVPLRLRGEAIVGVSSLQSDDGRALYLDRAGDAETGPEVDELVRQLDALPLAIELAAARARLLGPAAILEALADRFRLLAGGPRGAPARHRALSETIAWSWDLLSSVEQQALAQLSMFEHGFDLTAADAVLDLPPAAPWTLDVLSTLLEHSLLRLEGQRFGMLLSIRDFARLRLRPTERVAAELRHAEHYSTLASEAFLERAQQSATSAERQRLVEECANFEAATRRMVARGHADEVAAITPGALHALELGGRHDSALVLVEQVLGVVRGAEAATYLRARSVYRSRVGDAVGATEDAHQAAQLASSDLERLRATTLEVEGLLGQHRLEEAEELARQGLLEASGLGEPRVVAGFQAQLGVLARNMGRMPDAIERLEAAVATLDDRRDARAKASYQSNLAVALAVSGRYAEAGALMEQAGDLHREVGNADSVYNVTANLAILDFITGDLDGCLVRAQLARVLADRCGLTGKRPGSYATSSDVHLVRGEYAAATQLLEEHTEEAVRFDHRIVLRCKLGIAYACLGRRSEALPLLEGVLAEIRERPTPDLVVGVLLAVAVALGEPEPERRDALLAEAVELSARLQLHPEHEQARVERAWCAVHEGRLDLAEADIAEILEHAELADVPTRALALALDARVASELGHDRRADASRRAATALAARLRVGPESRLALLLSD